MSRIQGVCVVLSLALVSAGAACAPHDGDDSRSPATRTAAAAESATPKPSATLENPAAFPDRVARGEYLVQLLECDGCHTPKIPGPNGPDLDMTRRLSGHPADEVMQIPRLPSGWSVASNDHFTAWAGPWGISYTANLTPHVNNGLHAYTDEIFVKVFRTGLHMGTSRPILPPMPWHAHRHLSDDDLIAIRTFLRTIPAIDNRVPLPTPPLAD